MRRLAVWVCGFVFTAFVAAQAVHIHYDESVDSCCICVLGHNATRNAPAPAPAPALIRTTADVFQEAAEAPAAVRILDTPARAPPAA